MRRDSFGETVNGVLVAALRGELRNQFRLLAGVLALPPIVGRVRVTAILRNCTALVSTASEVMVILGPQPALDEDVLHLHSWLMAASHAVERRRAAGVFSALMNAAAFARRGEVVRA